MNKIQLSHRMYSINDILRLLGSEEMVVQPKYQRRRSPWPKTAKTSLIDSILNNFPIPPIYIRDYINDDHKRIKEIVDGQQRITIVREFLSGNFSLYKNFPNSEFVGLRFTELPNEVQQQIQDYELSFIAIQGASEPDVIAIFSRINSFSLPLNTQEKRNALYAGDFKSLVYELSSEHYNFWTNYRIITDAKIARMRDAELVSELLTISLVGYRKFSKKIVDKMYFDFDEDFSQKRLFYKNFNNVFDCLGRLFENSTIHSLFRGEALFFTLFLVIYEKSFSSLGEKQRSKKLNINLPVIEQKLANFVNKYYSQDFNPDTKLLFQQGTGALANRIKRHQIISKVVG